MALIAVRAVIHVTASSGMPGIRLCLCMASGARKHRIIGRIGVAIAARFRASVTCLPPCMVERRSCPCCRGMARSARGREPCGLMAGVCSVLVFSRVTRVTIGRGPGIFAVDVAQVALHSGVRTGQRERCRTVIKGCVCPGTRIVTG